MIWQGINIYFTQKLHTSINTLHNTLINVQATEKQYDERELTSYELERLEREEEFDQRINRLKEEIAEQHNIIRRGTVADELHPSVHNLPHDAVQTKYDILPDVEFAE